MPNPAVEKFAAPITAKDLASAMGVSTKTVKRWWKRLGVPPTVPGVATHRWSAADAQRLLKGWRDTWRKRKRTMQP